MVAYVKAFRSRTLRSRELSPTLLPVSKWAGVTQVAMARKGELVSLRREPRIPSDAEVLAGRLVVYIPQYCTDLETCEEPSGGFFDRHDAPPWDVWVGPMALSMCPTTADSPYDALLAWVPSEWLDRAEEGVAMSIDGAVIWLDDIDPPVRDSAYRRLQLPRA